MASLTREEQQAASRREAALTALTQHPSWPELLEVVREHEEEIQQRVLAITVYQRKPVDQLEIARLNGFIRGMRWFCAVPEKAEASLARYLREHGVDLEGSSE